MAVVEVPTSPRSFSALLYPGLAFLNDPESAPPLHPGGLHRGMTFLVAPGPATP